MKTTFIIFSLILLMIQSDSLNHTKKHHTKDGFQNIHDVEEHGGLDFFKWQFTSIGDKGEHKTFPVAINNPSWIKNNTTEPVITWINHATFLIQIDGVNILTDPIFSERCSPVQWAGPKRTTEVGLKLEDLPVIDFIVISHDHYDHLDKNSVKAIQDRQKDNPPTWYVPLKVDAFFKDLGIDNVVALDWWDMKTQSGFEIHCVPAQHFSGRSLSSRNSTLWSGWVFKHEKASLFFAGDTGYSPDFKEIGNRLGPFDVSMIPIGAYKPRWFMGPVHVDPEQAVQIHQDVKSRFSIGMHWGTFPLADEDMDEPPKLLKEALRKFQLNEDEFIVIQNGEVLKLKSKIRQNDESNSNAD